MAAILETRRQGRTLGLVGLGFTPRKILFTESSHTEKMHGNELVYFCVGSVRRGYLDNFGDLLACRLP